MITPEGALKAQIKRWLIARGAYFFMPVQTGYGKRTIDFLCCVPYQRCTGLVPRSFKRDARFVGIETKAPGKEPTGAQDRCIKEINEAGGLAFWCDNFADFLRTMELNGFFTQSSGDAGPHRRQATAESQ